MRVVETKSMAFIPDGGEGEKLEPNSDCVAVHERRTIRVIQ